MPLKVALGCAATWPDAWDNDLLCIRLLFRHGLADITWLKQWLEFKAERQSARGRFLAEVRAELEGHVAPG